MHIRRNLQVSATEEKSAKSWLEWFGHVDRDTSLQDELRVIS